MSMGDCVCGWNESEGLGSGRHARTSNETVSRRERCVRCAVGFDKTRHSSQFPAPSNPPAPSPPPLSTRPTPIIRPPVLRPPAPRCTLPQLPDSLTPLSGTLGAATPQYRRYTHGARVQRRSVQQARANTQHNTHKSHTLSSSFSSSSPPDKKSGLQGRAHNHTHTLVTFPERQSGDKPLLAQSTYYSSRSLARVPVHFLIRRPPAARSSSPVATS